MAPHNPPTPNSLAHCTHLPPAPSICSRPHQTKHKLTRLFRAISLPLPTHRLASSAQRALEVDTELSPFVRRSFALTAPPADQPQEKKQKQDPEEANTVLKTTYRAATNRMLRVAVNGFMESLGVVLGVMAELDVDVLKAEAEIEG